MSTSPAPTSFDDAIPIDDRSWMKNDTSAEELAQMLLPVVFVVQKRLARCPDEFALSHGPPTISQVRAVLYLADHQSGSVGELAEALELSRPAATELIDRLVERNMVTRTPNPADRRQVMVALTPKAHEKSRQVRAVRLERLTRVISRLEPDERKGFVHGMMLLAEAPLPMDAAPCAADGTLSTPSDPIVSRDHSHD